MTCLGGFSVIFSILQLISNLRAERARNREREQAWIRVTSANVLHTQGAELSTGPKPTVHRDGLETHRAEMKALRAWLGETRERNDALEARILPLSERITNGSNGRDANGRAENNRGE